MSRVRIPSPALRMSRRRNDLRCGALSFLTLLESRSARISVKEAPAPKEIFRTVFESREEQGRPWCDTNNGFRVSTPVWLPPALWCCAATRGWARVTRRCALSLSARALQRASIRESPSRRTARSLAPLRRISASCSSRPRVSLNARSRDRARRATLPQAVLSSCRPGRSCAVSETALAGRSGDAGLWKFARLALPR